ncbi:siderophore-interacting protein [Aeromicrobium sp.]|uniref:siderophore-interacting protein n=1 Tax=Aeromicrobium sp. TaxID=1871063 RepID=UPI0025B9B9DD|nr:siderophore-interacting protein [Aeromicrobium sp.]MCK5891899.1 siderophore-interacting protein [Aeromicrobium sp.]
MPATGIRELEVLRREVVTPRMVRVVLGGPGLAGFASTTAPDEHVKLVFPDPDGTTRPPVLGDDGETLVWPRPFPENREYTIRRFDEAAGEVWIDFVVHPGGLASDWAQQAERGESLWVAGPRPSDPVPPELDHHVLLADHTALPAVARWLEELRDGVDAQVAVLVPDAAEEQDLAVRPGVSVVWLHLDDPDVAAAGDDVLGRHLDALDLPGDGRVFLWAAGEAGVLKPVRRWARAHGFARGTCDIAGYWRKERTTAVRTTRR